eukprot:6474581-Amphidinium_carterae.1
MPPGWSHETITLNCSMPTTHSCSLELILRCNNCTGRAIVKRAEKRNKQREVRIAEAGRCR